MTSDKPSSPSFLELRLRLSGLIVAAGTVCLAATVFGFLAAQFWLFDLFSHFRVQYLFGLVLCTALVRRRHRCWTILFAAAALANLATIVPLYLPTGKPSAAGNETLRAVLANVNREFGSVQRVGRMLGEVDPDIIVLEEVNARWLSELAPLLAGHPHSLVLPREDNFGIALFSRLPLETSEVVYAGEGNVPSLIAVVLAGNQRLTVVATHPFPPGGPYASHLRNSQLEGIAQRARTLPRPLLLLGDLNVTPWSPHFGRLVQLSDLEDSGRGRGVQPTWPTWVPLFWIPIDHCLHSRGIHIVRRRVGPYVESDHFPLIVDFTLPAAEPG